MQIIYFFSGLPASGKSTEALAMLKQHPNRYKRVNKDSIRTMLVGPDFSFKSESMVENIQNYCIETALGKGFDVICDNTNLKDKYYFQICDVAKKIGDIQIIGRYFECSLQECLTRNKNRPNPVPEELIVGMHKKYIVGKVQPDRNAYFPPNRKTFEVDPKLPNAIIYDLDGTTALNESGRSYYDTTRFLEDSPNIPVIDVIQSYKAKGYTTIALSGRNDIAQADTETWLKTNNVPYDMILMRVTGDNRPDDIVKKEIFEKNVKGKFNILFVLDDRQKVVDKWRELGLSCFQVNPGNF